VVVRFFYYFTIKILDYQIETFNQKLLFLYDLIFLALRMAPLGLCHKVNILLLLGYWKPVCMQHNNFNSTMQMIIFVLICHAFYQSNIIFFYWSF